MILQFVYKPLSNSIYKHFTGGIPDWIRSTVIMLGFLIMIWTGFFSDYGTDGVFPYWDDTRDWIFAGALLVVIIFSIDRKMEILKWSIPVWLTYAATGILIVASRLDHDPGDSFIALGVLMLTEFICLGFVWGNRRDYDKLFKLLAIAVVLFNIVIIAVCFKNYPYVSDPMKKFHEAGNYWFWHVKNPNGTVKLFLAMDVGAFYLARTADKIWKAIPFYLLLGIDLYITYITNARNALLIIAMVLLAVFVDFIIRVRSKEGRGKLILRAWVSGICILLGIAIAFCALTILQRDKIDKIPYRDKPKQEEDLTKYLDGEYDFYSKNYMKQRKALLQRDEPELWKLDQILTGRVYIWKTYFEFMDTKGHTRNLGRPPHNLFMLLAWRCGSPAGIVWFICCILIGLRLLVAFFRGGKWIWFSLPAYSVFIVQAMLEQGIFPMERPYVLLFYIGMLPFFLKDINKKEITEIKTEE